MKPQRYTVAEIASILGISYQRAQRMLQAANLLNWQPGDTKPTSFTLTQIQNRLPAIAAIIKQSER